MFGHNYLVLVYLLHWTLTIRQALVETAVLQSRIMLKVHTHLNEKHKPYSGSGLSGSCPNLIDRIEEEDIDGKRSNVLQNAKLHGQSNVIASALLKPFANIHVDIIISSAEAEDIEKTSSLDSISDMLPKYRQRSQSLDKVRNLIPIK